MGTVNLSFDRVEQPLATKKIARFLSAVPAFNMDSAGDANRQQVEKYISAQFMSVHGATITHFMPLLFSIRCNNCLSAAAGIRPGGEQTLFLEQYLSTPVEKLVSKSAGKNISRIKIAEIGNMAATRKGSTQLLFLIFCAALQHSLHEWIVFTATPPIIKGLQQLGFQLHTLGNADPEALTMENRGNWGSYYDSHPKIVAGDLGLAMEQIIERKLYTSLIYLFQGLIIELSGQINHATQ